MKINVKKLPKSEQGNGNWKYGIYENGNLFAKRDTKANAERDAKRLKELSKDTSTSKSRRKSPTVQERRRKKEDEGWKITSNIGYRNGTQKIVGYTASKGGRKNNARSITALLKKIG